MKILLKSKPDLSDLKQIKRMIFIIMNIKKSNKVTFWKNIILTPDNSFLIANVLFPSYNSNIPYIDHF